MKKRRVFKIKGLKGKIYVKRPFFIKKKLEEFDKQKLLKKKEIDKERKKTMNEHKKKKIIFKKSVFQNNNVLYEIPPEDISEDRGYT